MAVKTLEPLLSTEDVATYLGVPLATVYQWHYRRTGPTALKVGRHLRYRRDDVERWLAEQAVGERA